MTTLAYDQPLMVPIPTTIPHIPEHILQLLAAQQQSLLLNAFATTPAPIIPNYTVSASTSATPNTILTQIKRSPSPAPSVSSSSSPEPRVKRGRPQQDILDGDDPNSQKRKHRRLYARQYRAQMRQRVDEVKTLKCELDDLKRKLQDRDAELRRAQQDIAQKTEEISHQKMVIGNLLQTRRF